MRDVEKFISKKKKRKKAKRLSITVIILSVGLIIFFTKAPIFNVKNINIEGIAYLSQDKMKELINNRIGENIFTLNIKKIKSDLMSDKYVKSVKIKRSGISEITVSIEEEAPVFYVKNGNKLNVINENLEVVEEIESIENRNLVEITGINNEKNIDIYKEIISEIYPYVAKNKEQLRFDRFDLSEISNIKGYMGNVEILFGDDSDLHNKMENVYRIMLDEKINIKNGYINVMNNETPIIKKNE